MTRIDVPEPCVVLLVGAAGAGKSTFAARHFHPSEVLSSDALRAAIAGDPADQRASRPAFAALHRQLGRRLAAGRTSVVDATNVTGTARRAIRDRARSAGTPTVAIVFDLAPALVLARNATRAGRPVPEGVVRRQLEDLATSLADGSLEREGHAAIHLLRTPAEVDGAEVRRAPAGSPGEA